MEARRRNDGLGTGAIVATMPTFTETTGLDNTASRGFGVWLRGGKYGVSYE